MNCDHDELKRSTFDITMNPGSSILDAKQFSKRCTTAAESEIAFHSGWVVVISNQKIATENNVPMVGGHRRKEVEKDVATMSQDEFLNKYSDFAFAMTDKMRNELSGQ